MKKLVRRGVLTMAVISAVFLIIIGVMAYMDYSTVNQVHIYPNYEKQELGTVLSNAFDVKGDLALSAQDYKTLLYQTGLGKPAVDQILLEAGSLTPEALAELEQFQQDFFAPVKVLCKKIGIITFEEKLVNDDQVEIKGFGFADLKKGDILINKSSHSTGWRHGHSAIVIDAENQKTMEAILLGYNSTAQSMEKWRSYPSFILLRLSDSTTSQSAATRAAVFAAQYLDDVPYGLLAGFMDKAVDPEELKETQCAHLVWYAYHYAGYDIDSDGGWLVTPRDMANSNLLEVVQIYGVDPSQIWP